tara:strand:+ start:1868 stop:2545 length:678 start_codon:yes stop_codon:yes gene_type:complete
LYRKVSEKQKKDILVAFKEGIEIKEISKIFNFTVPTINRQLRNILGEETFIKLKNLTSSKKLKSNVIPSDKNKKLLIKKESNEGNLVSKINSKEDYSKPIFETDQTFIEIVPLNEKIEFTKQKELTSVPIEEITFPKILYMIINNNIELEVKLIKDYPNWSFLPESDQKRMTIEIFSDQKVAKRFCTKNQKIIKIPNTKVFEIASNKLIAKGISRIVFEDYLISL